MVTPAGATKTVILVFPSGSQFARSNLRALERAGMLSLFCTTIAWRIGTGLAGRLPQSLRDLLKARNFNEIASQRIRSFPLREIVNRTIGKANLPILTRHETGWASSDAVSRALDASVSRLIRKGTVGASAVYGYEYAALQTLEAAAQAGMRRFYELPIGYWRAGLEILTEESERNPDWAPTLEILRDSKEKWERKDAELLTAEHVVVPSDFVRDTLRAHPGMTATIDVIPYGAPSPRPTVLQSRSRPPKLRVLYVGHLSQRKGISYLFEAMRRLTRVATLTLVGPKMQGQCPALAAELRQHTWLGVVPHGRVLDIMAQHDLFVFPSLFEGFAQVILEAMAQGLPVITTHNSGGSMAIDEGVDGFLVPIRDPDAIVDRVMTLAGDRERLEAMSRAALLKAERMSWIAREKAFIRVLCERLGVPTP